MSNVLCWIIAYGGQYSVHLVGIFYIVEVLRTWWSLICINSFGAYPVAYLKEILWDVGRDEIFNFSPFHQKWNDPGYHPILRPQYIHVGLLCVTHKYSKYSISYTTIQEGYQDPGKGKVIFTYFCHNYNSYSLHVH